MPYPGPPARDGGGGRGWGGLRDGQGRRGDARKHQEGGEAHVGGFLMSDERG